ncbi:Oidioi.mRNA.OKI2018_I69.chr1.g2860.t1.cds [Oikopleura dioica]|uniref:Oidioi.mRNA.OKI2018_I69.chr1.g2860.t1.cds n=1 Tax=Oikopleura dioica TaxID=34765 RepID=A0ABN7SXT6_OIKDI|nr:Oidioi.mRNA.OKI2018_I69.chr1.g2860.t1.cds [Oikopleura dioica]
MLFAEAVAAGGKEQKNEQRSRRSKAPPIRSISPPPSPSSQSGARSCFDVCSGRRINPVSTTTTRAERSSSTDNTGLVVLTRSSARLRNRKQSSAVTRTEEPKTSQQLGIESIETMETEISSPPKNPGAREIGTRETSATGKSNIGNAERETILATISTSTTTTAKVAVLQPRRSTICQRRQQSNDNDASRPASDRPTTTTTTPTIVVDGELAYSSKQPSEQPSDEPTEPPRPTEPQTRVQQLQQLPNETPGNLFHPYALRNMVNRRSERISNKNNAEKHAVENTAGSRTCRQDDRKSLSIEDSPLSSPSKAVKHCVVIDDDDDNSATDDNQRKRSNLWSNDNQSDSCSNDKRVRRGGERYEEEYKSISNRRNYAHKVVVVSTATNNQQQQKLSKKPKYQVNYSLHQVHAKRSLRHTKKFRETLHKLISEKSGIFEGSPANFSIRGKRTPRWSKALTHDEWCRLRDYFFNSDDGQVLMPFDFYNFERGSGGGGGRVAKKPRFEEDDDDDDYNLDENDAHVEGSGYNVNYEDGRFKLIDHESIASMISIENKSAILAVLEFFWVMLEIDFQSPPLETVHHWKSEPNLDKTDMRIIANSIRLINPNLPSNFFQDEFSTAQEFEQTNSADSYTNGLDVTREILHLLSNSITFSYISAKMDGKHSAQAYQQIGGIAEKCVLEKPIHMSDMYMYLVYLEMTIRECSPFYEFTTFLTDNKETIVKMPASIVADWRSDRPHQFRENYVPTDNAPNSEKRHGLWRTFCSQGPQSTADVKTSRKRSLCSTYSEAVDTETLNKTLFRLSILKPMTSHPQIAYLMTLKRFFSGFCFLEKKKIEKILKITPYEQEILDTRLLGNMESEEQRERRFSLQNLMVKARKHIYYQHRARIKNLLRRMLENYVNFIATCGSAPSLSKCRLRRVQTQPTNPIAFFDDHYNSWEIRCSTCISSYNNDYNRIEGFLNQLGHNHDFNLKSEFMSMRRAQLHRVMENHKSIFDFFTHHKLNFGLLNVNNSSILATAAEIAEIDPHCESASSPPPPPPMGDAAGEITSKESQSAAFNSSSNNANNDDDKLMIEPTSTNWGGSGGGGNDGPIIEISSSYSSTDDETDDPIYNNQQREQQSSAQQQRQCSNQSSYG